jgi:hypothetical protein
MIVDWIEMNRIHSVLDQTCPSFKNQTPLHLSCAAMALETARLLIRAGANRELLDDQHRSAAGNDIDHAYQIDRSIDFFRLHR